MDVTFYEAFEEEAAALRRCLPAGVEADFTPATIREASHAAPPAPLISIRTQTMIPPVWAASLKGVLSRSTGYDHLQVWGKKLDSPPAMGYLPLYCHRACAEQAIMLMLALMRHLPRQMRQFHTFHRNGLTGGECRGKTLAVVGVGNIGYDVYQLGRALGMDAIGVDIDPRHDDVNYASIDTALPQADVIVCAMALTDANRGYFDAARLRRAKRGALLVNVSRGELSPSVAVLSALESGHLGGVALDVYNHEAELADALRGGRVSDDAEARAALALAERDDAICTPHNAFNTTEAVARKAEQSVQQVALFLAEGRFRWPVPDDST